MLKKFNLAKIAIGLPGAAVALYIGLLVVQNSLENRLQDAIDTGGEWHISGAFPLLDAFHVSTIRATSAYDVNLIKIRHALFYGWPFQYCCGDVDKVRLGSVHLNLTQKKGFPKTRKPDETVILYNMLSPNRIEIPELTMSFDTPIGAFDTYGSGVMTTDELDKNSKHFKASFAVDNDNGNAKGTIRARLTSDGALNGQIILESATVKKAMGFNGKRMGGILDFEKRVGQEWIFSGEGSAGFMNILGRKLKGVEIYYLDDNTGDTTILLKSTELLTGELSDIEIKINDLGQFRIVDNN